MTWEQLIAVVGLVGAVCAIIFGVVNVRRASDSMTRDDATRLARIEGKLDSANRGIEDMRVDMRSHGNQIADHAVRIAKCEESVKSAQRRLDNLEHSEERKGDSV